MKLFKLTIKMASLMLLFSLSFFCAADDTLIVGTGTGNIQDTNLPDNGLQGQTYTQQEVEDKLLNTDPFSDFQSAMVKFENIMYMKPNLNKIKNQKITITQESGTWNYSGSETINGDISGTATLSLSGWETLDLETIETTWDLSQTLIFNNYSDTEDLVLNSNGLTFTLTGNQKELFNSDITTKINGTFRITDSITYQDTITYNNVVVHITSVHDGQKLTLTSTMTGSVIINGQTYPMNYNKSISF
ncbi:MAG: hypothetical protein OEZ22_12735 [Spirochaetia bacterium]|nr:hypothetical protein [Spirochaetia bacterium]